MIFLYLFIIKLLFVFIVSVSSPPIIEKSVRRILNFLISWALENAVLLTLSITSWIYLFTWGLCIKSSTANALTPRARTKFITSEVSWLEKLPSGLGNVFNVMSIERNFLPSPISNALLIILHFSFKDSSIKIGGIFSPPAEKSTIYINLGLFN